MHYCISFLATRTQKSIECSPYPIRVLRGDVEVSSNDHH